MSSVRYELDDAIEAEHENGKGFCCIVVMLVLMGFGNWWSWTSFAEDMRHYDDQLPAVCVEGRSIDDPPEDAIQRVGATAGDPHSGIQTDPNRARMHCQYPIAVHPCSGEDMDEHMGDVDMFIEACRANGMQPPVTPWAIRMQPTDIICSTNEMAGAISMAFTCNSMNWYCEEGACNAFDKTRSLCETKVRAQPYICFFSLGPDGTTVKETYELFPVGWAMSVAGVSLASCCCCSWMILFARHAMQQHVGSKHHGPVTVHIISILGCLAVTFVITLIVRIEHGRESQAHVVMLILLGSVCGLLITAVVCLAVLNVYVDSTKQQPEAADGPTRAETVGSVDSGTKSPKSAKSAKSAAGPDVARRSTI
eukprot:gnl/TRDRNA2_/TRDRNA2_135548_c0_seq1.p1 gnl/TRDRNA2_/TRDRNA2_135548_c0~~gnl/TRDRNA2_/TRDRNA2_135548_c0_seq1.p1  ORF type:complete len:412 (+),score=52.67 gnl/TRDRNA2_/TRDRNA2_135548_c0_seq1:141-1238(+)